MSIHLADTLDVGNPGLNIGIFAAFVVVTLAIVVRASRSNRSAADYYAGGRALTGRQNGIATNRALLWMRFPAKLMEYLRRPGARPA